MSTVTVREMKEIERKESDHITYDRNGMHHTGYEATFLCKDGQEITFYEFEGEDGNIEYFN